MSSKSSSQINRFGAGIFACAYETYLSVPTRKADLTRECVERKNTPVSIDAHGLKIQGEGQ